MVLNLHDLVPLIVTALLLAQISTTLSQNYSQICSQQLPLCGHQLRYPFWGGERLIDCGYPGFELSCQGNATSITIASTLYRVLAIDYQTETLTVARSDFWNTTCPASVTPTTVNFMLFQFSQSRQAQNITLFYDCIDLVASVLPNRFNCSDNGNANNFYRTIGEETVNCARNVTVPVNESAFVALSSMRSSSENLLRDALISGFSLRWTAANENCTNCTGSGGVCGYNQTSAAFVCYRPSTVSGSGNNQRSMPVGLFVAGGVLTGVGLGWCAFYCLYRRKRRISSKSAAKQSTPSHSGNPYASNSSPKFTKSTTPSNSSSEFGTGSTYFGLQVFSYSELQQATDGFNSSRELGNGGFGIVYYGILPDARPVAIKRLYENNYRRLEQFMNELEILSRLKHENLVKLFGCTSRRSRELLLVYEFIPNGTVADHLLGKKANSTSLTWPIRLDIAIETADALAYLHRSDIIHRDVKTNNILLDNEFHVKVADFGLSRLFPTDVTHVSTAPQGTPGYVDPEYYQIYHLTEKSDVYSFGVILIELISSLPAVDTNRNRSDINLASMAVTKILNHSLQDLVDPNLGFETNLQVKRTVSLVAGLAFRCLQPDSNMRPSMGEVVEQLKSIKNGCSLNQNAHQVEIIDAFSDDFDDEEPLKGTSDENGSARPYSV